LHRREGGGVGPLGSAVGRGFRGIKREGQALIVEKAQTEIVLRTAFQLGALRSRLSACTSAWIFFHAAEESAAMTNRPLIVWFQNDLRLADQAAVHKAVESGAPLLALYVLDEKAPGRWVPGSASRWWLHHSL